MSGSSRPKGGEVDPRIGTLLAERYRIDALVGEGGMGKVYSAEHVLMRKRLAVKVLRRELTSVPDVVARFEREAMAAGNIEHPNVAGATDFGKLPDGSVFLVLEFVSGHSLRDELARAVFPVERALHVARQIASALAAAHAQGIVHRDLKPENVMLVEKGGDPDFVKVLDFGIAKVPLDAREAAAHAGNPITKAGMVFGTPEYMAPEQALGQNVDGRADLYALGVMMFEMLSGARPFISQSSVGILGQQLSKPAPSIAERAPGIAVPPAAEQVVHKLLARESAERYQSAAELARAIDELLAPIPGQGVYRFTLSDGSRQSLGGADTRPVPDFVNEARSQGAHTPSTPLAVPTRVDVLKNALIFCLRRFERWRRHWPLPLRRAVDRVPTPALLLACTFAALLSALLVTALCVASWHALRGKSHTALSTPGSASAVAAASGAPTPVATAAQSEIEDAQKSGISARRAADARGGARRARRQGLRQSRHLGRSDPEPRCLARRQQAARECAVSDGAGEARVGRELCAAVRTHGHARRGRRLRLGRDGGRQALGARARRFLAAFAGFREIIDARTGRGRRAALSRWLPATRPAAHARQSRSRPTHARLLESIPRHDRLRLAASQRLLRLHARRLPAQ